MHLPTLLLAVMSAGALALPTKTIDDSISLEKRNYIAWAAAFPDNACSQPRITTTASPGNGVADAKAIPKFGGGCNKVNFATNYIGVNWGVGEYDDMKAFDVFSDDNCKQQAAPRFYEPTPGPPNNGVTCYNMTDTGPWKSMVDYNTNRQDDDTK